MHWELQPTPQGCQLVVDGQPIGSPSEPPPSGWLQRQYGILMPPEYEIDRLLCRQPTFCVECEGMIEEMYVGDREILVVSPGVMLPDGSVEIVVNGTTYADAQDTAQDAAAMAEIMQWWIESGRSGTNPPGEGSAFNRIAQAYYRAHGYVGANCPTREDFLPYCDPCTQPLCGDVILPDCPMFGPNHPDCQRPPRVQVDPCARVEAFRRGYESGRRHRRSR